MRRLILIAAAVLALTSCGSTSNSLYYWGGTRGNVTDYEQMAYRSYDKQTPQSICNLIAVYETMVSNPGGTRMVPPPGICAEYGYILMREGSVEAFSQYATAAQRKLFSSDDYSALFAERGREMMRKELEYYPESEKFLRPLLEKAEEDK